MSDVFRVLVVTSDPLIVEAIKGALSGAGSPGAARIRDDFIQRWKTARGNAETVLPRWSLSVARSVEAATDALEPLADSTDAVSLIIVDGDVDQQEGVLLFALTGQAVVERAQFLFLARNGGASIRMAMEEIGDPDRCSYLRKPATCEELARSVMFVVWRGLMAFSLQQAEQRGFSGVGAADLAGAILLEDEAEKKRLAVQDALTQLGNRRLFDATLADICALPDSARHHALMLIDLDRFKAVNDTLGHSAGDDLLRQVAGRIRRLIGPNDVAFRLGGDEFALIKTDVSDVQRLADLIVADMCTPFEVEGHGARIGASIGWAAVKGEAIKAADWVCRADLALYAAKDAGRGVAIQYSDEIERHRKEREALEARARAAVNSSPAPLLYAAIADTATGAVFGVEAVLDFGGDGQAEYSEAKLDAIISDARLATEISLWTIRSAIAEVARHPELSLCVNLTARTLQNEVLADLMIEMAQDVDIAPERITVEAPSGAVFANVDASVQRLRRLAEGGFCVVLDSFGVGAFSLDGLQRLPVHGVKIAASLSREALGAPGAQRILQGVISIASGFGLRVAAAGVDSEALWARLGALGCVHLQGRVVSPLTKLPSIVERTRATRIPSRRAPAKS